MNRRTFAGLAAAGGACLMAAGAASLLMPRGIRAQARAGDQRPVPPLRFSLLHLAPLPGELERNLVTFERALLLAAQRGTDLAIAPELALSGYHFPARIGVAWIEPQPDRWLSAVAAAASRTGVAVLIGAPERDAEKNTLHNSAFLFDADGDMVGRWRKITVTSDGWSKPGTDLSPIRWHAPRHGDLTLGVLICADAYTPHVAAPLAAEGAELLVSPANWGPGAEGPKGEWEARSRETGLSFIVCNRTGVDDTLDFTEAESLVIVAGSRRLTHRSADPAVLTFDWDPVNRLPVSAAFAVDYL